MTHVRWNLPYWSPELGSHLHIEASSYGTAETAANSDNILNSACSLFYSHLSNKPKYFGPWKTAVDRFHCSGEPWKANYMGKQGSGYLLVYVLGRCLNERQIDMVVSTGTALAGKGMAWPTKELMAISGHLNDCMSQQELQQRMCNFGIFPIIQ